MAVEYDNLLMCKSNPDLLQAINPMEIIKESPSRFSHLIDGSYYFESRGYPIIDDVYKLSIEYPNEEFVVKFWNLCADGFGSKMRTIRYSGGDCKVIRVEPRFHYDCRNRQLESGFWAKRFEVFYDRIISFFEKIKDVYAEEWLENDVTANENKHEQISIQLEDEVYRVVATWDFYSHVTIEGFYKITNQASWKLIDGTSYIPQHSKKQE